MLHLNIIKFTFATDKTLGALVSFCKLCWNFTEVTVSRSTFTISGLFFSQEQSLVGSLTRLSMVEAGGKKSPSEKAPVSFLQSSWLQEIRVWQWSLACRYVWGKYHRVPTRAATRVWKAGAWSMGQVSSGITCDSGVTMAAATMSRAHQDDVFYFIPEVLQIRTILFHQSVNEAVFSLEEYN